MPTYSALNSAAKLQKNTETTKDKGQKRALERESRVRQSLMEGKLLWKRAEIASDYSDLNQGLYKQPGMLSEPAVQVRVHPQSDLSTAKIRRIIGIIPISLPKSCYYTHFSGKNLIFRQVILILRQLLVDFTSSTVPSYFFQRLDVKSCHRSVSSLRTNRGNVSNSSSR